MNHQCEQMLKLRKEQAVQVLSGEEAKFAFRETGTVQIGDRTAEYVIRDLDGSVDDCHFNIDFHILGKFLVTSGNITGGFVWFGHVFAGSEPGPSMSELRKVFGTDPGRWVKKAIENAIEKSMGFHPSAIDNLTVTAGETVDATNAIQEIEARRSSIPPKL